MACLDTTAWVSHAISSRHPSNAGQTLSSIGQYPNWDNCPIAQQRIKNTVPYGIAFNNSSCQNREDKRQG